MRICKTCGRELPDDEFYLKAKCKGGRLPNCRACVLAKEHRYRETNRERLRAYDRHRGRTEERKARVREFQKNHKDEHNRRQIDWYWRNKHKRQAHAKILNELKHGRMQKQPCEVCGSTAVQAHHDDYYKPLEVRWLCEAHHKEFHRVYREERIA